MGRTGRRLAGAMAAAAAAVALAPGVATAEEWRVPTLTLDAPLNTIAYAPAPVYVSGWVNSPSTLYVRVSDYICPDPPGTPDFDRTPTKPVPGLDGAVVGPGAFSLNAAFLPGSAIGVNSICAWAIRATDGHSVADDGLTVRSRRATASVTIAPQRELADFDVPNTVTVTGSAEVPRRLDLHYGDSCEETTAASWRGTRRITGEEGVAVGPGPFSVTLPWTPDDGEKLCAYVSPQTALNAPDATASATIEWVPPTVWLESPADGVRLLEQSPRLRWAAGLPRRYWPISEDVLTLTLVDGRKRIPALRATTRTYRAPTDRHSGRTSEIASVSGSSIRFKTLWPGTYEWTVAREEWRTPPAQRFTIVGKQMRRIAMTTRMRHGISSRYAAVMDFSANAGVRFVDYRLSWRSPGARWQYVDERHFDGRMRGSLWSGCKRPGGRTQWQLVGRDSRGTIKSRKGSFANPSASLCAQLKAAGR